jgi:hypothetical protein
MDKVTSKVLDVVKPVLDNQVFMLVISSIVILNVIHSLDSLPEKVKMVLLNPVTKVLSVFTSIYYVTKDVKMSFIWSIVLVAIYNLVLFIKENFEIITNTSDVMIGCQNAKVSDLLALFNGDESALRRAMYTLSVPLNIELNDENAGKIATYFVNHGKKVSESCRSPSD